MLGALGGFFGGKVGDFLEWLYNVFTSIPDILLIFAFAAVLRPRHRHASRSSSALTGWTGIYRQVRAEFIKHSTRDYVRAAEAIGASTASRMFRHILPNVSHVILVRLSLLVVGFIKSEVILSYLGLGVGVDEVSWGTMLSEAQSELILGYWWQLVAATVFMAVFVTAFSLMTDAAARRARSEAAGAGVSASAGGRCCRSATCGSPSASARKTASSAASRRSAASASTIPENTTVALVGESGSGKSVTAMSIAQPAARQRRAHRARSRFEGRDLLRARPRRAAARCAARRSPASSRTR